MPWLVPTEETAPTYSIRELVIDCWKYLKPYRLQFVTASLFRLISDIANLYPAIAAATIVDMLSSGRADSALVWQQFFLMVLALVIRLVGIHSAKWIGYQAAIRVGIDAKMSVLSHMESLHLAWHERENSGNKLKRIERGGDSIEKVLRLWINSYIEIAVNFVGIVIILATIDKIISGLLLTYAASFLVLASWLMKPAVYSTRQVNIEEERFTGDAFELIANIRTVKVLGMGEALIRRTNATAKQFLLRLRNQANAFLIRNASANFWTESFRLGIIGLIIANIFSGHYEVGVLVLFSLYFGRIAESVNELADNAQQMAVAREGVARMKDILNEPILSKISERKPIQSDWKKIRAEHVQFGYGDTSVLHNVSFEIRRGEKIGIVGLSGAGKSTLFKLLLKERDGFTGSITFDAMPIQSISRESYFKRVAVVLQETEVFNFSLKDNIVLANPDAASNETAFRQALEISHVAEFVHKLPQGVDTLIGEKGFRLSGGERQRLGIARAVFKQPDLLFLDEATSHLDSESEAKIQDSLHKFFQNVTAIVIAHRLSTIKEMDRILVLEKGKIIESGSFNQLFRKKGRFRELWEKQRL